MIFQSTYESYSINQNDLLEGVTVADYSGCSTVEEAGIELMQECAINWENFNRAIATTEMKYMKENGVPMQYVEENVKDLISGGIKIIKEWFSKAMGFIQRAANAVAEWIKSKVSFVTQHQNELKNGALWPDKKTIKGYNFKKVLNDMDVNYKLLDLSTGDSSSVDGAQGYAMGVNSDISKYTQKWVGDGGKVTVATVKKNILGPLIDINGSYMKASDCMDEMKTARTAIDGFKKLRKETKEAADKMIGKLKKIDTKVEIGDDYSKSEKKELKKEARKDEQVVHSAIAACNKAASLNNTLLIAKIGVYNEYIKQIDHIARVYVGGKKQADKDEKKYASESAKVGDTFGFESCFC